jgi:hypothetical protein
MNITGSVSFVANLGTALRALNPAGYNCSAMPHYMIGRRSIGRSSCNPGLYPAPGIRPCPAASSSFTVAPTSVFPSGLKVVDSARPTAPPRPALLWFAANTCCPFTRSGRSTPLHASRAWAHGPLRGPLGRSGMAAHAVRPCFPECESCRALHNPVLQRTRNRGRSVRPSQLGRSALTPSSARR